MPGWVAANPDHFLSPSSSGVHSQPRPARGVAGHEAARPFARARPDECCVYVCGGEWPVTTAHARERVPGDGGRGGEKCGGVSRQAPRPGRLRDRAGLTAGVGEAAAGAWSRDAASGKGGTGLRRVDSALPVGLVKSGHVRRRLVGELSPDMSPARVI